MFKKPLSNLKTSAPLRSSDRRKLKQRVVQSFNLSQEVGDLLVPDGILSVKFSTHLDEPGIAYLAPDGDPLWFTVGKGSDSLIPTVYTLWKQPRLLPFLATPPTVIPVLVGGADLMIPGVIQHSPSLHQNQLVSITQYEGGKLGPPLAVGSMAVDSDTMRQGGKKGKAVHVLHTWKDSLFDQGNKAEPPEAVPEDEIQRTGQVAERHSEEHEKEEVEEPVREAGEAPSPPSEPLSPGQSGFSTTVTSPQEVSALLRSSLLQSINTTLSALPPSAFPISATIFYTSYILPSRPSYLSSPTSTPVDIKHSTHKSLTAFLKVCEKEGLVKLKDMKSELVITGVFPLHTDVIAHRRYETLKDVDIKREKREEAEEAEKNKVKEMQITEMWKPHQQTIKFFEETGNSTSTLYPLHEIKSIINDYVVTKGLVNARETQYINVDALLVSTLTSAKLNEEIEFLKRNELAKRLVDKMQSWYEIQAEGRDTVVKKGQLKPVSVVVKVRQGRKASTLIVNFEPYFLTADFLAEELRRICASATSVSPVPGKGSASEVLVQGKQIKAVTELLASKGIPKKWIEAADMSK